MIVLLDTNILLDVLANRQPFVKSSRRIWELSELNEIRGVVSAVSFNNIYYIVRKADSSATARECLRKLRSVFSIAEVDDKILNQAIDSDIKDFEDAIQYFCSLRYRASHLVTRNPGDFPATEVISIITPEVFLLSRENPDDN